MDFQYKDATHEYLVDGQHVPSLTQMLEADGLNGHLDSVPPAVLQAKAEWGTRLHLALQKAEYGCGVDDGFQVHCAAWLEVCRKMQWGPLPVWKNCELPVLAQVEGFVFGFTPDRAAPEAIVEIKGTYSPQVSHGIQTALQVVGMGYPRSTPRYVVYFDKTGLKKLHQCGSTVKRDNREIDVYAEADRIIFEHALTWEGALV